MTTFGESSGVECRSGMDLHEHFLRKRLSHFTSTPQSLLVSALWGYLKCTLSERNNSLDCCDVSVWAVRVRAQ
jgi:16S rRNA G1207 methylase RsmC